MRFSQFVLLALVPPLSACESAHMKKCMPECVSMHEECEPADETAKFCKKSCTDTEGKTADDAKIYVTMREITADACKYTKHAEAVKKASDLAWELMNNPPDPSTLNKECPMCAETVKRRAKICRYCQHDFR